jgi:tetratricopeptide (TPR) repeat protein
MGRIEQALDAYRQAEKSARLFLEPLKKSPPCTARPEHRRRGQAFGTAGQAESLNVDRKSTSATAISGWVTPARPKTFSTRPQGGTRDAMESLSGSPGNRPDMPGRGPGAVRKIPAPHLEAKKGFLDKSDIETFNRLGITLRKQGRWEDASRYTARRSRSRPRTATCITTSPGPPGGQAVPGRLQLPGQGLVAKSRHLQGRRGGLPEHRHHLRGPEEGLAADY